VIDLHYLLISDPNVSPAFRRLFVSPPKNILDVALGKAAPRRFTGEPLTGFGGIDEIGSDRYLEVRDQEGADHDREEQRSRVARGE
jgi:hypothetical protein